MDETTVQSTTSIPKITIEEKPVEVLIVDDSISVRKVLNNFILDQGWHPSAARDGAEALEKIRKRKPDILILDVEMPRMNGFEVLQVLQYQSRYRNIPVVMITSRSAEKYREKAIGLGARGFINKPFKRDELVSVIGNLVS